MSKTRRALLQVAGVLALLTFWQVEASVDLIDPATLPPPLTIASIVVHEVATNDLIAQIWASLQRACAGFLIGAGTGLALGVAVAISPRLGSATRATIEVIRPIPPLAWITLAIIWFGLGDASKVFVIALAAFFPAYTSAEKGVRTIDPVLIRAGRALGRSGWRMLQEVVIPAAAPEIATGLKVAWSWSFAALVASELFAAESGLGYVINRGRIDGDYGLIVAAVLIIACLAVVTERVFREITLARYLRWMST